MAAKAKYMSPKMEVQFSHLTQHEVIEGADTGKYSVTCVLDPEVEEHKAFMKLVHGLFKKGMDDMVSDFSNARDYELPTFLKPHKKKDEQTGRIVETGKRTLAFKTQYQPNCWNTDRQKVDVTKCTWGSEVIIQFVAVPWAMKSTKKAGVALYPQNILIVKEGGSSPEELFEACPEMKTVELPDADPKFVNDDDLPF